jgi:hypothetical protein
VFPDSLRKVDSRNFALTAFQQVHSRNAAFDGTVRLAERGGIRTPDAGITGVTAMEEPPR